MPAVLTRPRLPRCGAITFAALWTVSAACSSGIDSTPTNYTTAPSTAPVVYIAGTWNGTIESANFAPRTIKMIVVQSGNCVDGVWDSSPPEWTGAISGFATVDSYTGQISLERQASDGSKCTAVGNVAGPVTDATLRWTGDTMKAVGPCSGDLPTSIVITLRRQ